MKKIICILFLFSTFVNAQTLIYWFVADSLGLVDGAAVTSLPDYSGNSNDFAAIYAGYFRENRALISGGAASTHDAVGLANDSYSIANLDTTVSDYTFIFVYDSHEIDDFNTRRLFDHKSTRLTYDTRSPSGTTKFGVTVGGVSTIIGDAFSTGDSVKVIAMQCNSPTVKVYIDSVLQATTANYTAQDLDSTLAIGSSYASGNRVEGDLFEFRIYRGTMSDADVRSVSWDRYLHYRDLTPTNERYYFRGIRPKALTKRQ